MMKLFLAHSIVTLGLAALPAQAISTQLIKCTIPTKNGMETFEACARKTGETVKIESQYFKKILFDKNRLAGVHAGDSCYWINSMQVSRKTFCFDNGPDYFVEGFARYVDANGRFGFIDTKLNIAIEPTYDFVFPFEKGRARVCNGCRASRDSAGEHSSMSGGIWSTINRKGNPVPEQ